MDQGTDQEIARAAAPGATEKATMLQQILAANPKDSFARYGLAMDYAGRNELDSALDEFATLLRDNPNYTPGYFMAAQTLVRAGRTDAAKNHLERGIASARREGNAHAQREMQALLDELELDS
jgi:thioredoxin-like negative regulator of GroEL